MFTTLEEAIDRMHQRFAPAGRELAAWPVPLGAKEDEVLSVEASIGARLPDTFRSTVLRYDFLNAVAGNVAMTHASTFDEWLAGPNVEPLSATEARWWAGDSRPEGLILIAQSDAHSILLNLDSGEVMAVWLDDPSQVPSTVAKSFPLFYQGLAAVYLAGLGTDAAETEAGVVVSSVGADLAFPFWLRFATRAA